jgi:hypothetical protein
MAYIPNRDDPFLTNPAPSPDELRRGVKLDNELQPDPELAEGPASGTRVALYAIAAMLILGAVFYGLSSPNTSNSASTTPAQTTANSASPSVAPAAPGIRDVTPRNPNAQPGVTTGAAPSQSAPAQPAPAISAPNNGAPSGADSTR